MKNLKELNSSTTSYVLYFSADFCGPCKKIKPFLEELSNDGNEIYFVDCMEEKDFASKYNIKSIPCLVFIKDGIEKHRHVGLTSKEKVLEKIKDNL